MDMSFTDLSKTLKRSFIKILMGWEWSYFLMCHIYEIILVYQSTFGSLIRSLIGEMYCRDERAESEWVVNIRTNEKEKQTWKETKDFWKIDDEYFSSNNCFTNYIINHQERIIRIGIEICSPLNFWNLIGNFCFLRLI